jgi:acyl dehydratase
MAAVELDSVDELRRLAGSEVAVSDWLEVSQERIDRFAAATGDHQWIHVDRERARRESPYGATVAHGFLTLSLLAPLFTETIEMRDARLGVNYGFDRVRFTGPVPAGARIRARFALRRVEEIEGGLQLAWQVTVEREGAAKPVCIAEWITRRYR